MTSSPTAVPEVWTRLHPVTPLILGGRAIGVFVLVMVAQVGQGGFLAGSEGPAWAPLAAIAFLALVVAAIAFGAWWMNQFRVDDDAVHQRKGILFRQYRQARLDRLQAVDVVQPLIARVFGFAELKVEVAGGKSSGVRLQYLRVEDAEALRNQIVALAAGIKAQASTPAPAQAPVAGAHGRR